MSFGKSFFPILIRNPDTCEVTVVNTPEELPQGVPFVILETRYLLGKRGTWMTEEEFKNLKVGDCIRSRSFGQAYFVAAHCGDRVVAVRTIEASNPIEWERVVMAGNSDGPN